MVRCRIICASQEKFISHLNQNGVETYKLKRQNELVSIAAIHRKDYRSLVKMAQQYGADIQIVDEWDFIKYCTVILRRPILIIGLFLWIWLVSYLPTRILFVTVCGNKTVPEQLIVEVAKEYGVYFGAVREDLRNEKIKNALLSKIPQLEWVGVNTYGCVAEIAVRERIGYEGTETDTGISSLVATHDGIISNVIVLRGSALCTVGQAVSKGQTLISGFTDCGLTIRAERAAGSVYAYTNRTLTAYLPVVGRVRRDATGQKSKFSLKIGKNIINLSISSGISHSDCAKIYSEKNVVLPGGFRLPISLVCETEYMYNTETDSVTERTDITDLTKSYLHTQIIDGNILGSDYEISSRDELICLAGSFYCREIISRERREEISVWEKK